MNNLAGAISNMIPITMFNRGKAGQIFEEVKKTGAKIIIKNNEPECILISPDDYVKLMDDVENAKLILMAADRLNTNYKTISEEDVLNSLDITIDELNSVEDVEIG
ncbi:MAG: type II toxin-antitoxin system Phd/YefM family antitoxin [Pseudobutyrivibrio ruminis]|uniref:Type II toxin-antitoxin system Phd/YefM family antitoxin n=1 Tax=Pseudobutyrivibrio ruminis TaxID=46206 RepID=A0A927U7H7_9FIRM|nr:type II toxin-antitoxin system Phd/YefM family antitoxin [Pseudobutyrivibrio ruminis]